MNTTKILFAAAALTLAACGQDSRSSVWVQGRAASSSDTECTYAPGGEFQLGAAGGVLDLGPEYSAFLRYELPIYLRNDMQLPVGAGQSASGNDFLVENVRVQVNPSSYTSRYHPNPPLLDFAPVGGAPARASVAHSGPPVAAGGGESATVIEAIPSDLGFVLQQAVAAAGGGLHKIVLGISVEGRTNDGTEIEVDEYFYPIELCQGCLPRAVCVAPQVELPGSCGFPGQDVPTVCADPTAP
jgi:hypothetical protein